MSRKGNRTPASPPHHGTGLRQRRHHHTKTRTDLRYRCFLQDHASRAVYRLRDLGESALHDWGWVLWEFQELVLIDRTAGTLALVVAAID
ncbi:hypothetical protein [Nocardia sp. 2YAB30]|uniref:hypothetical protein n=1 Tax=Nocardia sp. 2YAB30 TaxID=3233022 RepID=UPI003F96C4AC